MSELYLVLRHRLEDVAVDWVAIPSPILKRARKRQGLSYENLARQLNVVAKTWERYEKAGRVPRPLLPRVADVLNLEIEDSQPQRVTVTIPPAVENGLRADIAELRATTQRSLAEILAEIQARLPAQREDQDAPADP